MGRRRRCGRRRRRRNDGGDSLRESKALAQRVPIVGTTRELRLLRNRSDVAESRPVDGSDEHALRLDAKIQRTLTEDPRDRFARGAGDDLENRVRRCRDDVAQIAQSDARVGPGNLLEPARWHPLRRVLLGVLDLRRGDHLNRRRVTRDTADFARRAVVHVGGDADVEM